MAADEQRGTAVPLEGLLGKKLGMVQVIAADGTVSGCTVLEVGPCAVTQIKTRPRDGYQAVQVGFAPTHERKLSRAQRGHLGANGLLRHLAEFRTVDDAYDALTVGQTLTVADLFTLTDRVDVSALSKGRGFAGVVKRHGFHGGPKTHGQSDRHRARGAIGSGTTPGRVYKGTRMAGRMGGVQRTSLNLQIVQIQPERSLLYVLGSVPGAPNGLVRVTHTKKRA